MTPLNTGFLFDGNYKNKLNWQYCAVAINNRKLFTEICIYENIIISKRFHYFSTLLLEHIEVIYTHVLHMVDLNALHKSNGIESCNNSV
jgi:hypothetical protein